MTNFEKWKDKILELAKKYRTYPAVVNGIPENCGPTDCGECDLHNRENGCVYSFLKWACEEYKEKPKLTKRQRGFCEVVETGWMARDKGGVLFYYCDKPVKTVNAWHSGNGCPCIGISKYVFPEFLFIRWEDEEPYSIEEMLAWEVEE